MRCGATRCRPSGASKPVSTTISWGSRPRLFDAAAPRLCFYYEKEPVMSLDANDSRLTAYALGELSADDLAEIEELVFGQVQDLGLRHNDHIPLSAT